ncbi:CG0192-related protein [Angustibacter aerolatus]
MATIHRAEIRPTKAELLDAWVPAQPWYPGGALTTIGAFRFDDPAEEVGVETFLLRAGDAVVQVPLTYRAAPLAGADDALVTTMEHSVLGRRWVYDGCADPVFAATLAHTVLTGGVQAELLVQGDDGVERREPDVLVTGSGRPGTAVPDVREVHATTLDRVTVLRCGDLELAVARVLGALDVRPGDATLTGTWADGRESGLLAAVRA